MIYPKTYHETLKHRDKSKCTDAEMQPFHTVKRRKRFSEQYVLYDLNFGIKLHIHRKSCKDKKRMLRVVIFGALDYGVAVLFILNISILFFSTQNTYYFYKLKTKVLKIFDLEDPFI